MISRDSLQALTFYEYYKEKITFVSGRGLRTLGEDVGSTSTVQV